MMIKLLKRAVVLGLTSVVLFTGIPAQTVKAADEGPLHTSVKVEGRDAKQTVTYNLDLDEVLATDGRVAVTFDADVLELTKASDKVNFDEKDLNQAFADGDSQGVSFAFVNAKSKKRGGRVLHLKFSVKPEAQVNVTDTVIKTKVFGIYNEDETVVANTVLEDAVTVGRKKPVTPQNVTAERVLGGIQLKWDADDAADYFVIYRAKSENGEYKKIGTSKDNSYLSVFVGNKDYYFKVVAHQNGNPSVDTEPSAPVKVPAK